MQLTNTLGFGRPVLWTAALMISVTGSALAAPIFNFSFNNPTGGCSGSSSPASSGGSTMQVTGGGFCQVNIQPTPPAFPGGPPGFIAQLAPNTATISGTGSGVFDGSFFPIGFTASGNPAGPLTATFLINGTQIRTGLGQGFWDVANQLLGQTLSSWQVSISGGGGSVSGFGFPQIPNSFGYCVFFGTNQLCNTAANNSPTNPILPINPSGGSSSSSSSSGGGGSSSSSGGGGTTWVFQGVPSGRWTDPPFVNGFAYAGTGGTLFDRITLPTGFGSSFTIRTGAGNALLGTFAAGAVVDFLAGGVSTFQILDIQPSVDAALPNAFPLQVFFEGGGNGDFTQTALETTVPEPATWLMMALAVPLLVRRRS